MVRLGDLTLRNPNQTAGAGASFIPSWTQQISGQENEDKSIWLTEKVGGTEGTSSVNGGINSAKVEGNHRPVPQVSVAERVAQHDGGSLTQPEHRSFIPGYSNGLGEKIYELA